MRAGSAHGRMHTPPQSSCTLHLLHVKTSKRSSKCLTVQSESALQQRRPAALQSREGRCEYRGAALRAAALEWLWSNAKKPAVATLSLGIPVGAWSKALETAVQNTLRRGILVVVAAGEDFPSLHASAFGATFA